MNQDEAAVRLPEGGISNDQHPYHCLARGCGEAGILAGVCATAWARSTRGEIFALHRKALPLQWKSHDGKDNDLSLSSACSIKAAGTCIWEVSGLCSRNGKALHRRKMMTPQDNGLNQLSSRRSVLETMNRLESVVLSRGLRVIARIDHAGDAADIGLKMPPAQLLIFGNPLSGTPLMIASPTVAIDLPLKALVWQDATGRVWVSYNTLPYLQQRHGMPQHLLNNIAGIASICEEAVRAETV